MLSKKPRIGITLSEAEKSAKFRWPMSKGFDYIKQEYYRAILESGGLPVLLPNVDSNKDIMTIYETIDGLLVTGGVDIHPRYFNQRPHPKLSRTTKARDTFETEIIKSCLKTKPILGICRGHQVLNVVLGGNLHQDLSCLGRRTLKHADSGQTGKVFHKVKINKDSLLHNIIGKEVITVNSSHHQVVDKPGKGLKVVAFAPDDVVEALELPGENFVVSVQWHPEGTYRRDHSKRLFDYFVKITSENI